MRRKSGYDCPRSTCDFHTDDVLLMSHHTSGHKTPVLTPSATWHAIDYAENVLGTATDLEGRHQLELDHPGAEIIHDIERRRRENGGKLPRVGD